MKSWIVSILLGFYLLSLCGPASAFSTRGGFTIELNHQHSQGSSEHSHAPASSHHHHASSEKEKTPTDDSHCHKICVSACAPVYFSQNVFSFIPLETSAKLSQEPTEIISSNESGSIFRPPIFV